MKKINILLLIFSITGCTTSLKTLPVMTYLQPVHTTTSSFNKHGYKPVELLDNDGNMYITYWDIKASQNDDFNLTILECRKNIKTKKLFNKAIQVAEISIESITPSLFKQFNSCIQNKHYTHKYSDAFAPDKYKLTITRPVSSSGEYMPVGAKYYISRKETMYKEVLITVTECDSEINKTENKGIDEIHSGGYSHVSIQDHANDMTSCLLKNNYLLNKDNTNKPDD